MKKNDFKKDFKDLFTASAKNPSVVNPPAMNYLMVDGKGDPNKKSFQDAVAALYGMAYTIKFALKKTPDYTVPPLEALWWMDGKFDVKKKDKWQWTLMLMQPAHVTKNHVKSIMAELKKKKPNEWTTKIRLENFSEGLCIQILHVGPYNNETKTIKYLHNFISEAGCEMHGKHHEIYISDPRKTPPAKLKTILRQPILMPAGCGGSCSSCVGGCG